MLHKTKECAHHSHAQNRLKVAFLTFFTPLKPPLNCVVSCVRSKDNTSEMKRLRLDKDRSQQNLKKKSLEVRTVHVRDNDL